MQQGVVKNRLYVFFFCEKLQPYGVPVKIFLFFLRNPGDFSFGVYGLRPKRYIYVELQSCIFGFKFVSETPPQVVY